MGSDAKVFLFDDAAYVERVVPAVRRFVDTGEAVGGLEDLLATDFASLGGRGFSFDAVCDYLGPDFAFSTNGVDWSWSWEFRPCPSDTCPARNVCPLHWAGQASAEDFNLFLAACIVDQCLGQGQFVGRSVSPAWYVDELAAAGLPTGHPLHDGLQKLAYRGLVVGPQFSNSDGIHGWLTSTETVDLHLQRAQPPCRRSGGESIENFLLTLDAEFYKVIPFVVQV